MERKLTLEDVRGDAIDNGSFKKLQDYARAVTKNEEEFNQKMTRMVLGGFRKKMQGTSSEREEFDEERRTLKEKGVEMVKVIEKTLTASDVNDRLARLSLPEGQIMVELLSTEEREELESTGDEGRRQGKPILLIEPSLEIQNIVLSRWRIGNGFQYVLCSTWNEVKRCNGLQRGDRVEVRSFELGGNLGLVLFTPEK